MPGTLYVVATPIGNLDEMTPRAVKILSEVDMIAAEDTRTSSVLLKKFNINTNLSAYHMHNEKNKSIIILDMLLEGKNIALISDAGTPCISDPGYLLVKLAAENGIKTEGISGSCAIVNALSVSGFDTRNFTFIGFLPRTKNKLNELLKSNTSNRIIVFYESPLRIKETIKIISGTFPECRLCLCNDLTKKFEKIYRGSPEDVFTELSDNPNCERGEYTCVIDFGIIESPAEEKISAEALLVDIMLRDSCTLKDAVKSLSMQDGFNKNDAYDASLNLKKLFPN